MARVLVAIPAYNEEATIADVVQGVRDGLPEADLVVVNDGSRDRTGEILRGMNVPSATHLCNLGYGRAIQTAIKCALAGDYVVLVTLDADGQHRPDDVRAALQVFDRGGWDLVIGSRYVGGVGYEQAPFGRRVGMKLFSSLTRLATGRRVYDTTSGLKVFRRSIFPALTQWHFVDFHAEAIVYLARLGYRVGEHPITVDERKHGTSMYSAVSYLVYPLMTAMMVMLAMVQAGLTRRARR